MITLSIADLRRHRACHLLERVADLAHHLGRVPADDEAIPLATWWALPTTSVSDIWWSLRAVQPAETAKRIAVAGACRAARRVLHLTRPQDRAVCEAAILATEGWLAGTHTVKQCREAADAANAAADAARAAARAAPWAAETAETADAAWAARAAAWAARAAETADAEDAAWAAADAEDGVARAAWAAARAAQRADLIELLAAEGGAR